MILANVALIFALVGYRYSRSRGPVLWIAVLVNSTAILVVVTRVLIPELQRRRSLGAEAAGDGAAPAGEAEAERIYCAPRRFGLGSVLVVTSTVAVLLALFITAGVPPRAMSALIAALGAVAFAQMALFHGEKPRLASVIAGVAVSWLVLVVARSDGLAHGMLPPLLDSAELEIAGYVLAGVLLGPLFGYLGGGVVGGLFLAMETLEQRYFARREPATAGDNPWGDEVDEGLRSKV